MKTICIFMGIIMGIAIGFITCNWVWNTMLETGKLVWK